MATEASVGVINQTGAAAVQVDAITITPLVAGTPIIGQTNYRQAVTLGDPTSPLGFAPIDPILGLSIASAQLAEMNVALQNILAELQAQTVLMGGISPTAGASSALS